MATHKDAFDGENKTETQGDGEMRENKWKEKDDGIVGQMYNDDV